MSGFRPAIIGLISAAAFSIFTSNLFIEENVYIRLDINMLIISAIVFGCAFFVKNKLHPVMLIVISAVLGVLLYKFLPVFVL